MEPLLGTESAKNAIARVSYSHDAMIDLIIARPDISQNDLAAHFGYSVPWVSRIMCSDAFQARLAERKDEIVTPMLKITFEERLKALAAQSMDILADKLEATKSADVALEVLKISTKSLGYGARQTNVAIQNNFVAQIPNKIESSAEWAKAHTPAIGN